MGQTWGWPASYDTHPQCCHDWVESMPKFQSTGSWHWVYHIRNTQNRLIWLMPKLDTWEILGIYIYKTTSKNHKKVGLGGGNTHIYIRYIYIYIRYIYIYISVSYTILQSSTSASWCVCPFRLMGQTGLLGVGHWQWVTKQWMVQGCTSGFIIYIYGLNII